MMGSTDFFNQEETNEGITAEEEQMLQRLQRKKQKIESRRANMIQRSSSIKKPYPMFQDPQSYQEQKDNDPINLTPIRSLPRFQSLSPESSRLSQGSVQPNSRSSPSPNPTNPIQNHQNDAINTLTAQVTSLAKIVQSLQAPQSNHVHSKEPSTIMDSQARTEIERLKQAVKSFNDPFAKDSFDNLPRISLPLNCPLDFRKYNGTTDPLRHIKTFKMEIRPYTEDRQVLAYLF